jgi:hypothetical protein
VGAGTSQRGSRRDVDPQVALLFLVAVSDDVETLPEAQLRLDAARSLGDDKLVYVVTVSM